MIIGNGNIASILKDRKGALFFASGVSNSSCSDILEFQREYDLIRAQPKNLCCFYFSSISVAEIWQSGMVNPKKWTYYLQHKLFAERIVKSHFKHYNIIRIGNITWDSNPNTFLNFLREKIRKGESVEIRDEYKYMIDQKQLLLLTNHLPLKGQNEINVFGEMAKVKDLL